MNTSKTRLTVFIASVIISAAVIMTGCSKPVEERAFVSFFAGDVMIKHGAESRAIKLKDEVSDSDIIKTGSKSFAVVQMPGGSVCRIEENTNVEMSAITGGEKKLTLSKGIILSKIEKLKKGEGYTVKTPLTVAAVRGTEFLTKYNGIEAVVSVGEGKVSVARVSVSDETPLDAGSTAVVKDTVDLRAVNAEEAKELDKLKSVSFINDIDKKSDEELKEIGKTLAVAESEEEEKPMSLNDIKKKYNRIDVVMLYSGKVIKGAIVSRGKVVRIVTPSGPVAIESNKIKKTSSY
jgi:hypothetical protein